jgi:putative transposase
VLDAKDHQLSRPLFLNTGGFDGHQARIRRQIDALKAARARLAPDAPEQPRFEAEIGRCWRRYEARNHTLAHLAANRLLLFAAVWGCSLLAGESLTTLKSTGRGRGVRGRWRNWRNNTTIRAEIWRILRYKCHLAGIRFRSERPRGTSHTCPRCGKPARTYRSPRPEHRTAPVRWGRWLLCAHCPWSGDRDYAAALNIARLGVASLTHTRATGKAQAFAVTEVDSGLVPLAICQRARCCCFHRRSLGTACSRQASSTSMAGSDPPPCAPPMRPRSCYACAGSS